MRTVNALLLSARPRTLPAAAGPVIVGAAMAYAAGPVDRLVLGVTLVCALLIQVGTNYANDYYDFVKGTDTAERVGPPRATAAGLVSPAVMRTTFMATFAAAGLLGCYLVYEGGIAIALIGAASIACGLLYTAGPLPLGYLGLGDVFVLVFFGPVAVGGTYYLQTGRITWQPILAGLGPGLISTAVLTVNNFRDYHTDKQAGKRTLVVRFGRSFGKAQYVACIVGACTVPLLLSVCSGGRWWANLSILMLAVAWSPMRAVLREAEPAVLNRALAQTGVSLVVYSVLFSLGWLI
ncbi:MAG TPA: 1,4-dihydroxy-2-naphthoate polyprenyltransferase [Phycisphaerales bacterium]|nr:1,4-dihydroxy-2-naphthoate polyprenyltransferase [Phycisphaerales bacterium]